jgi:hypothetical protein
VREIIESEMVGEVYFERERERERERESNK